MSDEITTALRAAAARIPPPPHGFEDALARGRRLRRRDMAVRAAVVPLLAALVAVSTSATRPHRQRVDVVDHPTTSTTEASTATTAPAGPRGTPDKAVRIPSMTLVPPPAAAPWHEQGQGPATPPSEVAFAGRNGSIFAMRPDGSHRRDLAYGTGELLAWSPDRRTLLFHTSDGLTAVDVQSRATRTLVSGAFVIAADYSPDGTRLVYGTVDSELVDVDNESNTHVWVARADGTEARELPGHGTNPSWTPDGTRVMFGGCVADDGAGVCTIRPDGTGLQRLPMRAFTALHWSPDGQWIAGFEPDGIVVVRPDGSGQRTVASNATTSHVAWSLDSRSLVYDWSGLHRFDLADGRVTDLEPEGSYPVAPWR